MNHTCHLCPAIFQSKGTLHHHQSENHAQISSFTCQVCNTNFAYKSSLKRHLKKFHNNVNDVTKEDVNNHPPDTDHLLSTIIDTSSNISNITNLECKVKYTKKRKHELLKQTSNSIPHLTNNKKLKQESVEQRSQLGSVELKSQLESVEQKSKKPESVEQKNTLECTEKPKLKLVKQTSVSVIINNSNKINDTHIKNQESTIGIQNEHLKASLFVTCRDFAQHTTLRQCTSFENWLSTYVTLTINTKDRPLSNSVKTQMLSYINNIREHKLWHNVHSVCLFAEDLDNYIDEQLITVAKCTVTRYTRFKRWYISYLLSTNSSIDLDIYDSISNTISSLQASSTITSTNQSLMGILDPYRLASFANTIIQKLTHIQIQIIDPFITRFFTAGQHVYSAKELITFGLDHLRYFIELALRFCNVPCRIQCTINLMMPSYDSQDYVAKIKWNNTRLSRIINRDKTGDYAQLSVIDVDQMISGYLLFYIKYCRPNQDSKFVFQAKRGGKWTNASKDIKQYLMMYGIDCNTIAPDGRFIHCSRHIGLAVYSVLTEFNIAKIRNFATLMRHQLISVEHIYSPWMKIYQGKQAIHDVISSRFGETISDRDTFRILSLKWQSGIIHTGLITLLNQNNTGNDIPIIIRQCDKGTQTTGPEIDDQIITSSQVKTIQDDNFQLPSCVDCGELFSVFGPVGTRRSKRFGQYYLQCMTCAGRMPNKHSTYYKLGIFPRYKSKSIKPRNLDAIQKYIRNKTNKYIVV